MKNSELCVFHFWKNIIMFFVFFPKRLTHILSKLILIFLPFLFFFFFFFFFFFSMYFLGIQTQKILIHKSKKFSHTQKKTFKPQHTLSNQFPSLLNLKPSSLFQNSHNSFKLHGRPPLLIATTATTTTGNGSLLFFL